MSQYCVYIHRRPGQLGPDSVFYVGCRRREKDGRLRGPWSAHNKKASWLSTVEQAGGRFDVDIVFQTDSREEAQLKEIELIALYGRLDLGTGTLVNVCAGGRGVSAPSAEVREKISEVHAGKTISTEHRAALSRAFRGRPQHPNQKRALSEVFKVHRKNQRQKLGRPVIDTSTGQVFGSIPEAAESAGLPRSSLCARLNGRRPNNTSFRFLS